jgi:amidase
LELGSDIGGSIRTPSNFCGVYGHKPTLNLVPMLGHIPPRPGQIRPVVDLPVAGPMSRSASDLRLQLEVLAGPEPEDAIAYQWHMPLPRASRLKDYRVGYVLDDPFCPVVPEVREPLTATVEALRKAGAGLVEGWPDGLDPVEMWETYLRLLAAFFSPTETQEELEPLRTMLDGPWGYYAKLWLEGNAMSHKNWLSASAERKKARQLWQRYFTTFDAFLLPESFVAAFPHDHRKSFFERTLRTSQGDRPYADILRWISFATLTGCPATVAPVGQTREGLPVGIQIMGPYLEDATTIDLAARIADVVGGFRPPQAVAG